MKVPAKIDYIADWSSESGDDQRGHIKVTTPTGVIEATWSCTGGKGDGSDLVSNTTTEFSDDEAGHLVNSADLCQGNGSYTADIEMGEYDAVLSNAVWPE